MANRQGQAPADRVLEILESDTLNPLSRKGQPAEIPKLDIHAPPPLPAPAPLPVPAPGPAAGPAAGAG